MDFLQKLDFLMDKYGLNKLTLSQNSGIPYTTIVGWYKKGYEGLKLTTLRKLSDYFNTILDYWVSDDVIDPNYWKANGFVVNGEEMEHITKYRILDGHGKKIVDIVLEEEYQHTMESQREAIRQQAAGKNIVSHFYIPEYREPASAGTGQPIGTPYPETVMLVKEPPKGTSFITHVHGDSMEPEYEDGDIVFVKAQREIRIGQIGVFFMDGEEFLKELGDGELISHNSKYEPIELDESIRCQGLVLGICDESYFFAD